MNRSSVESGKRYGRLLVLGRGEDYVNPRGERKSRWRCRCDCGNELDVHGFLLEGGQRECSRCPREDGTGYVGRAYGRLLITGVLDASPDQPSPLLSYRCACGECGSIRVHNLKYAVRNSRTPGCGCTVGRPSQKLRAGQRFGRLVVHGWGRADSTWRCRCDCGTEIDVWQGHLTCKSPAFHCGCWDEEVGRFLDSLKKQVRS